MYPGTVHLCCVYYSMLTAHYGMSNLFALINSAYLRRQPWLLRVSLPLLPERSQNSASTARGESRTWLCCADWFVGDPAERSVEVGVGAALSCGYPWRIAGSGELAVQLAHHGDPVQPGGGVD